MAKSIVNRVDRHLARRLREARREAGLSTRAVSEKLPARVSASHTRIAQFENGEAVPPIDVLAGLADIYKRPINWFLENRECLTEFRYRNLPSRISVGDKRQFEALASKWTDAYLNLGKYLGHIRQAKKKLRPQDVVSPQQLAEWVRKHHLNLDDKQPVHNIVNVLESFSAWAIEVKAAFQLDNATAQHGENVVVMLNPSVANERLRLNAAHELAYLLYGDSTEVGEAEKRAYLFATSLIFPQSQLKEAFEGKSVLKLIEFKERFGMSLVAMIYMAEQTSIINTTASRWLWSEIARRGWRQQEPGYVWRDRAIRFEMMLESAIQTKRITWLDAERITGVREDELRQRLADATNVSPPETKGDQETPDTIKLPERRAAE